MVAVAHLALARSQNTGAGILGKQMTKSSLSGLLFRIHIEIVKVRNRYFVSKISCGGIKRFGKTEMEACC